MRTSTEALMEGVDCDLVPSQSQLVLPLELLQLTRASRMMLKEIQELTARNSDAVDALPQAENLRELDMLVKMANQLKEIVVSHSL